MIECGRERACDHEGIGKIFWIRTSWKSLFISQYLNGWLVGAFRKRRGSETGHI